MKKISFYQDLAREMVQRDAERDKMFRGMDEHYHLKWDLPMGLRGLDYIRKFVTTDPFDAMRAYTRVFSSTEPKLKMQPLFNNPKSKEVTNRVERALKWWLKNAMRRGRAKGISDILLSAGLYDEVCAQVVMVDKQSKAIGMDGHRLAMAKRYGPFIVQIRNPREVHSRFSDYMLEEVVHCQELDAREVVNFWGDAAREIEKKLNDAKPGADTAVTVWDYWDADGRAVWAHWGHAGYEDGDPIQIMKPTEHGLRFIPWVIKVGGTNLDADPQYQRYPLLYSVYKANQWVTKNITETLVGSETLSHAMAPRGVSVTLDGTGAEVDYGDPSRQVSLRPGEQFTPIPPPTIDQNLLAIADRLSDNMARSTISRILQDGAIPSGSAFATLNLATQSAVKALAPHRKLSEDAIAEICTHMLYWIDYSDVPMIAYGMTKADKGEQIRVGPDDFDVDNIYIEVELTTDLPTDRQGRINAAAIAVQQLGMSRESGLEDIGVEDPAEEMKKGMYEALMNNELQIALQNAQQRAAMQWQMMQAQMQMQMQMQMQQQVQQQQMQGEQMAMEPEAPGIENATGQGYNPAAGGQPAQMMNPNATFEGQTGMARNGVVTPEQGEF